MSDNLLTTKIHPPFLHRNLVSRAGLVERLNNGIARGCRLTLICAPAGYGKSTLLSEWQAQADLPVAWLSLEKGENTPARFWNYFVAALNTLPQCQRVNIGAAILQVFDAPQHESQEARLADLVNALSALEERVVLVLDDLHALSETRVHEDLTCLIEHLPRTARGLHLVAAGRMAPPWPLARWRVRGELNELRVVDLRFRLEETSQFLQSAVPLDLSPQAVAALQKRTEGWIAGLQMAAISMQGRLKAQGPEGVIRFVETFSGSDRFILDYLMDEVIGQQPTEIRDFLLETSILERFTASLCNSVTGRQDSQDLLDRLDRANLFLIPLDDERQWFRYHHLFADLLAKSLKETRPGDITGLHQRASGWYADHKMLPDALGHALIAGDVVRVNEFVSKNILMMIQQVDLLEVVRRFEEIPSHQIASKPRLQVAYSWVKAYVGPPGDVDRILQQAGQALSNVTDALERQHLAGHLAAVRAYVSWMRGEPNEALKYAHDALENMPEDDWATRIHVLNIQGLAWQYQMNLRMAEQSFEMAAVASRRTDKSRVAYTYSNLAFVSLLHGRLRQAFSYCQQAIQLSDESDRDLQLTPDHGFIHAVLSIVLLSWNDLESAIACARKGVALAEQWKQADIMHFTLTRLSEALCAAGDFEEAFAVNARAMLLATIVSTWYLKLSTYNDIWLNLCKGDIPAAARKFEEFEPLVGDGMKVSILLILKVSLRYAQGRFSDIVAATEGLIGEGGDIEWNWYLLRVLLVRALALHALDREAEALDVLCDCLVFAAPEGFIHEFLERGAPMVSLLKVAQKCGTTPVFLSKLLRAFHLPEKENISARTDPAYARDPGAILIEPLSGRELEVLRFLNSSLAIPEIAREMMIAPTTLRTHVRNIYLKLDVHGRLEALQKARELGLL